MTIARLATAVLALGLLVGVHHALAKDAGCAPVAVGDGTGVYFLALGQNCTTVQADGYMVIAHLVRDDDSSEVLVLVDADHGDQETQLVAQVLAERVKDGSVDGGTWHDQAPE